jgi:uncharacterized protein (TIGR03118 family)
MWLISGAALCACEGVSDETAAQDEGGADLRVTEHDLASDASNPDLVNAWGMAIDPDVSQIWVNANGSDEALVLEPDGTPTGAKTAVPGGPSGMIYTESPAFGGDEFIFVTEGGTINGWQDSLRGGSVVRVDDSASGAVYKGVAVAGDRLFVTDFHNGSVDVYRGYTEESGAGFADPAIPAGFAPFGVAVVGDDVLVSYAKQDADAHDDVAGPGNGYIDAYELRSGRLERRLVRGGALNSPWGMVVAPRGWHGLGDKLLVGNFGDGMIDVYNRHSGAWLGALRDANDTPIVIDGLWGLMMSPDGRSVLFSAGPGGESHGLYGSLTAR